MLNDEANAVSVWVAKRISQTNFDEYLAEDYSDDDRPISRFAEDLGVSFYDHDFMNATKLEKPLFIAELILILSYGETVAIEADEAATRKQLTEERFNAVVALYDQRFEGIWPYDSPLTFLGTFTYNKPPGPKSPTLQPGDHTGRILIARTIAPNVVATAGRFGEVRFWDTTHAQPIAIRSKHSANDFVHALSLSADGTAMYTCSDEVLRWDLKRVPIESRIIGRHGGFQMGEPRPPCGSANCRGGLCPQDRLLDRRGNG